MNSDIAAIFGLWTNDIACRNLFARVAARHQKLCYGRASAVARGDHRARHTGITVATPGTASPLAPISNGSCDRTLLFNETHSRRWFARQPLRNIAARAHLCALRARGTATRTALPMAPPCANNIGTFQWTRWRFSQHYLGFITRGRRGLCSSPLGGGAQDAYKHAYWLGGGLASGHGHLFLGAYISYSRQTLGYYSRFVAHTTCAHTRLTFRQCDDNAGIGRSLCEKKRLGVGG